MPSMRLPQSKGCKMSSGLYGGSRANPAWGRLMIGKQGQNWDTLPLRPEVSG